LSNEVTEAFTPGLFSPFPFLIGLPVLAQNTREDLEKRRLELREEIKRINSLRSTNKQRERSVLTEVEDLDRQIRTTENLLKVTNQQANLLTRDINSNTNKIQQLRKELEKLKEDYGQMIGKSYKSKSQQSRIMFLLVLRKLFAGL
jgi:murein hydrolase activator